MLNAVHFGAGSIGRGFVGQLLFESGCRTVFVDAAAELVDALQTRNSYPLRLVEAEGSVQTLTIEHVDALHTQKDEAVADAIAHADLLSTAVGVAVLPRLAPLLASGLSRRAAEGAGPFNILLCENGWHVAGSMRQMLEPHLPPEAQEYFRTQVGLVECVIGRMVPAATAAVCQEDPLLIVAEGYQELPVNASALRGSLPPLPGLILAKDFEAYKARKLFLHNMGHAVLAYAGWQKGHEFIWQCAEDIDVANLCRAAMGEAEQALTAEYGFDPPGLQRFSDDLLVRFGSKMLGDTVARVASDPVRKLGPDERLAGAAHLCERQGVKTDALARGLASALAYDNPADPIAVRLQERQRQEGKAAVLGEICAITPTSRLSEQVKRAQS